MSALPRTMRNSIENRSESASRTSLAKSPFVELRSFQNGAPSALWASLGAFEWLLRRSWTLLERSWGALGALLGALGKLLWRSWDSHGTLLGQSWGALGAVLGRSWAHLGARGWPLGTLGRFRDAFGTLLGTFLGAFGSRLRHFSAPKFF